MSDNIQADKRLICTNCQMPLADVLPTTTSIRCTRCNTLMELDPKCSTSCLSCEKLHQANPTACVEEIVSIDITNNSQEETCEISGVNVEKNDHGLKNSEESMLTKAWRTLKRGLFQV